jgi:hypothetical protein
MVSLLTHVVFMETGGIFESTIEEFYAMDELMHFRGSFFINSFTRCMALPDPCESISKLLFELTKEYHMLYNLAKHLGQLRRDRKLAKS